MATLDTNLQDTTNEDRALDAFYAWVDNQAADAWDLAPESEDEDDSEDIELDLG